MQPYKKILSFLTPNEKKHASLLLLMILVMALLDVVGVASIWPFMAVITNPELVETNAILIALFKVSKKIGIENNQQFIFSLGVLVFIILVTSLLFKALTTYVQVRFIMMREYSICKRLVEGYLHQPYSWFLNRHSAELGKTILSEVIQVVGGGITPLITLIVNGLVTLTLIALLASIDPKLALVVGLLLGSAYTLVYKFTRRYLNAIGKERLINNKLRFMSVSEAFAAIKEIKVGGLEKTYINRFSNSAQIYAKNQASASAIAQLPRFGLEAIAFGGIILMVLYLMRHAGSFNNALPIISLYVFAGYRLMPALQQIYASFSQLSFANATLDKLYNDMKYLNQTKSNQDQDILSFDKSISLKKVYYSYPNTSRNTLIDINFSFPAKTTVGLVGTTGSGKTTTVDIILGLLEIQKGTLEVDGKILTNKNIRSWQKSIGYVPQHIYLSDDTVAANIAFGVNYKDINYEIVEKVSKIAKLHDFVTNELPKKYETAIGERGVRLSGGQRQRIGIARALYHDPKLLVLDEATSALDNQTEQAVMDAVNNLSKDITIILIAHRLNTVKNCDIIFKLEKGEIVGQGTFDELINNNKSSSSK